MMDRDIRIFTISLYLITQLSLLKSGECYEFSTRYPVKPYYLPGDTFTFGCYGTLQQGDIVQFLKLGVTIVEVNGLTRVAYGENSTVLATFGELDQKILNVPEGSDPLMLNISDRYSVEGSHDATSFDYTFTITNVQLEDHSNFSCTVVRQDGGGSKTPVLLRVLGPITDITIVHHIRGEDRREIKNYPEIENEDGLLTYNVTEPGYLMCILEVSNTPPTFWEMTLYDPHTKNTTNVTDKFSIEYGEGGSRIFYGLAVSFRVRIHFGADSPGLSGRPGDISYMDNGKTLTFKAKVEHYGMQEISTKLDIQFAPKDTACAFHDFQASIGTKNFTLQCYTVSNPEANVTWVANDKEPRQGISVQNTKEGQYLVSRLIIDEVREADFGRYFFDARNVFGRSDFVGPMEVIKGEKVIDVDEDSDELPWNKKDKSNGDVIKASTLLNALLFIVLQLVICR